MLCRRRSWVWWIEFLRDLWVMIPLQWLTLVGLLLLCLVRLKFLFKRLCLLRPCVWVCRYGLALFLRACVLMWRVALLLLRVLWILVLRLLLRVWDRFITRMYGAVFISFFRTPFRVALLDLVRGNLMWPNVRCLVSLRVSLEVVVCILVCARVWKLGMGVGRPRFRA